MYVRITLNTFVDTLDALWFMQIKSVSILFGFVSQKLNRTWGTQIKSTQCNLHEPECTFKIPL